MRRSAPYAPFPENVRLNWVWAAPLVGLGLVALGQIPILIIYFLAAGTEILLTGKDFAAAFMDEAGNPVLLFWPLVTSIIGGFASLIGLTFLWMKAVERRGARTTGWNMQNAAPRYLRGVAVGLALALTSLAVGFVLAPDSAAALFNGLAVMAGSPSWLLVLAVMAVMFVVQTAAEEFTFRGWMLSSIAGRRGKTVAVVVSALAFALAHIHYAFLAPLAGLTAMAGIGFIGVLLAVYAVRERAITGAAGIHWGFNFTVVVASLANLAAENASGEPQSMAAGAFMDITSIEEFDPSLLAGTAIMALFALGFVWFGRRKKPDSGAPETAK